MNGWSRTSLLDIPAARRASAVLRIICLKGLPNGEFRPAMIFFSPGRPRDTNPNDQEAPDVQRDVQAESHAGRSCVRNRGRHGSRDRLLRRQARLREGRRRPMGEAMRWVEVALPGAPITIALAPPPEGQQAGG